MHAPLDQSAAPLKPAPRRISLVEDHPETHTCMASTVAIAERRCKFQKLQKLISIDYLVKLVDSEKLGAA
ncbi:MAG: hypothetical protein QOH39_3269 [Verrucomicrobiota bacterium]|jgi:hypothetical protein